MLESGTVTQVCGNSAKISIERKEACGNCNACGLMSGTAKNVIVEVKNTLDASVGDVVEITFSAKTSMLSTVIAYMIPFAMLLIGVFLGYIIIAGLLHTPEEPTAAISGLIFAALSFGIVKLFDPVIRKKVHFEMHTILKKGDTHNG